MILLADDTSLEAARGIQSRIRIVHFLYLCFITESKPNRNFCLWVQEYQGLLAGTDTLGQSIINRKGEERRSAMTQKVMCTIAGSQLATARKSAAYFRSSFQLSIILV